MVTMRHGIYEDGDLDVQASIPEGLGRLLEEELTNLTPWHIMPRELALVRLRGLRERYTRKYVPFAQRQDNDDLACLDPALPAKVVVVHDFASEGHECRQEFDSFSDWFRAATEDMILFFD